MRWRAGSPNGGFGCLRREGLGRGRLGPLRGGLDRVRTGPGTEEVEGRRLAQGGRDRTAPGEASEQGRSSRRGRVGPVYDR